MRSSPGWSARLAAVPVLPREIGAEVDWTYQPGPFDTVRAPTLLLAGADSLRHHAAGYRLTPEMRTLLLDTANPLYMGGRMQFFAALYEDFRAFPHFLATGGVWPRSEHDPWLLEALKNHPSPTAACGPRSSCPKRR